MGPEIAFAFCCLLAALNLPFSFCKVSSYQKQPPYSGILIIINVAMPQLLDLLGLTSTCTSSQLTMGESLSNCITEVIPSLFTRSHGTPISYR